MSADNVNSNHGNGVLIEKVGFAQNCEMNESLLKLRVVVLDKVSECLMDPA